MAKLFRVALLVDFMVCSMCWDLRDSLVVVNDIPKQVHLSHGDTTFYGPSIQVVWSTEVVTQGTVQLKVSGQHHLHQVIAIPSNYTFRAPAFEWWLYYSPVLHSALATGLKFGTVYDYRVGSELGGYSQWRSFKTPMQSTTTASTSFAVVGDTGVRTLQVQLARDMLNDPTAESALILGDFCYADPQKTGLSNPNGPNVWDMYYDGWEFFLSQIPTMAVVGNHDLESNTNRTEALIAYSARIKMPNTNHDRQYYSYTLGPVRIIVLDNYVNSPVNGNDVAGLDTAILPGTAQYQFLEEELQAVDRTKTPWVVVAGHSPYYHSNLKHPFGTEGLKEWFLAIEDLLYENHVDVVLAGHVHNYERTYPVYKEQIDPAGPVHILAGTGGNTAGAHMDWNSTKPVWSAFRLDFVPRVPAATWGYGKIDANYTHLHWTWRTWSGAPTALFDEVWLVH